MEEYAGTIAFLWYVAISWGWVPLALLLRARRRVLAAMVVLAVGLIVFVPLGGLGGMLAWDGPSDTKAHYQLRLGTRLLVPIAIGTIAALPYGIWDWHRSGRWRSSLAIIMTGGMFAAPLAFFMVSLLAVAFRIYVPFFP